MEEAYQATFEEIDDALGVEAPTFQPTLHLFGEIAAAKTVEIDL